MDRRLLQRVALIGGALVLIGGAVLVLRNPDSGKTDEAAPLPVQQTAVQAYADKSVVVPPRGDRPAPPSHLDIRASERRLVASWDAADATGYEVRWGQGGRVDQTRFVAQPVIELDGLTAGTRYTVEVRTVDSFGQRSAPARGESTPAAGSEGTRYTYVDRFDGDVVPDPARWSLVGTGSCTKAAEGTDEDVHRLVVSAQCGDSAETVSLRSRAPFRLRDAASAPGGELGRFEVRTDRPGQTGELTLDLVPGPADLVGRAPATDVPASTPGQATVDDSLPPGTIRVQISGRSASTTVRVLVAPGTPLLGKPIPVAATPPPQIGVSTRWAVVLRTDGVVVERDGVAVGGGDVVPAFTEATALVGFAGNSAGLRAAVDLIGFDGAPTQAPPLVPAPRLDFIRAVAGPHDQPRTQATGRKLTGVTAAQLRITLVPQRDQPTPERFAVDIGGQLVPARTAVPGQPMRNGVRLPIIADVPPDALVYAQSTDFIPIVVQGDVVEGDLGTQVLTAELELTGEAAPGSQPTRQVLPRPKPALAVPTLALLDGAGTPIPALNEIPRGRLVLELTMDALTAQRAAGAVAGLAGVEISLDSRPLAGIPTVADGPGVGGHWRIALNTTELPPGGHTIQVTGIAVDANIASAISYAPFVIR